MTYIISFFTCTILIGFTNAYDWETLGGEITTYPVTTIMGLILIVRGSQVYHMIKNLIDGETGEERSEKDKKAKTQSMINFAV
jgi:xanthosine utilization system XapX-like protein